MPNREATTTLLLGLMTERDFQQWITDFATLNGWLVYHTHDSRRSNPGFPDLVLVRDGALMFLECKTMKGKVTPAQQMWLTHLESTDSITAVVRPSDRQWLKEVLA